MSLIVIGFYWGSLLFIGACLLDLIRRTYRIDLNIKGLEGNKAFAFFICFVVSMLLMGFFSLLLYIFQLPAFIYTLLYGMSLMMSVVYFICKMLAGLKGVAREALVTFWRSGCLFIISTTLVAILLFVDYVISTYFGTMFAGGVDAYVHLAKITGILNYGFGIQDSFYQGVVESRYHINIIHPLYIPLSQIFHLTPAESWNLSLGFFRLMQWLALISVVYFIARSWFQLKRVGASVLSAFSLLACMAIPPAFMSVAVYPTKIVELWIILFVISMSIVWSNRRTGGVMILSSAALISLTHPTYSLIAAIFTIMYAVVIVCTDVVLRRRMEKTLLIIYACAIFILMITPLFTASLPQNLTKELVTVGSVPMMSVFGVSVIRPLVDTHASAIFLSITALAGYVYIVLMLMKNKRKVELVLVTLLVAFYYLLVCNPVFMLLVQDRLPIWLLTRFKSMNILQLVIIPFGFYAIYLCTRRVRGNNIRITITAIYAVAISCFLLVNIYSVYGQFYNDTKGINNGHDELMGRITNELSGVMTKGSLVVAPLNDSYHLPAAIPIRVLAIDSTHATPSAASGHRVACLDRIFSQRVSWSDLDVVRADYIVIPLWYAQEKPGWPTLFGDRFDRITLIKQTSDYLVFEINKAEKWQYGAIDRGNPCYAFQAVEGSL